MISPNQRRERNLHRIAILHAKSFQRMHWLRKYGKITIVYNSMLLKIFHFNMHQSLHYEI